MKAKEAKEAKEFKMPPAPDGKAITKQTAPLILRAQEYQIVTEDHFVASWVLIEQLDQAADRVVAMFTPFVSGLDKLHKMAVAMRRQFLAPLSDAKAMLLTKRMAFRNEQEAKKRKAEAEAAKALQKQQQLELERLAKAEEKSGNKAAALEIREQKSLLPPPVVNLGPAVPKQEGSVIRKRFVFEITDANMVPREYCSPDMSKIRGVVNAMGQACQIPGVKVWEETSEFRRSVGE